MPTDKPKSKLKIKADDQLPNMLYVARDWDVATDETEYGAFDARITPNPHARLNGEEIVGVYERVGYMIVKNETQVLTAKE